jgi:hypothetical protein
LAEHFIKLNKPYVHGELNRVYGDLDGDNSLDVVVLVDVETVLGAEKYDLRAISLRDGEPLWPRPVRSSGGLRPMTVVSNVDGDGRAEVIVRDLPADGATAGIEVSAYHEFSGEIRWRWRGGDEIGRKRLSTASLSLADFGGKGVHKVCLNVGQAKGARRIVILDGQGRERAGLEVGTHDGLWCADVDGRNELLFVENDGLHATRGDFVSIWSRPEHTSIRQILRGDQANRRRSSGGRWLVSPAEPCGRFGQLMHRET